MVVSPDVGGVVRARALAKRLDAPLAIVDKRRERAGESEVMNIIGDVAGTPLRAARRHRRFRRHAVQRGRSAARTRARASVSAYITHGVLSGGAVARIAASRLKELVITDTIAPTEAVRVAQQHSRHLDRAADRRGDRPHRQGRERLGPFRLKPAENCAISASCAA